MKRCGSEHAKILKVTGKALQQKTKNKAMRAQTI